MIIKLKADILKDNQIFSFKDEVVTVKKETKLYYIFEKDNQEFRIKKKFAFEVK